MALDVAVPEPPRLSNRAVPSELEAVEAVGGAGDLRREELEAVLASGAWREAFAEWAAYTDLTDEEYDLVRDLGLLQELDVFWDPSEARLRAEPPTLPDGWEDRVDVSPSDARRLGSTLAAELAELAQTLVEMLEDGYVDWGETGETDPVWSEETFGHGSRE